MKRVVFLIPALVVPLLASVSAAQPAAQTRAAPETTQASLDRAKELFRQGVAVFDAGDVERALEYFRLSRAAYPSAKNTVNAALCLDRLGRFDEALEMYEDAVARFNADLDDEDRGAIGNAMRALLARVGSLQVSSNVAGGVVVDGQPRGQLPLTSPIRLMPGRHVVRVIKDGYMTFEAPVAVQAKATARVDARLVPLAASGGLRVEDTSFAGAEVVVDGAVVGVSPWEGTLSPGHHVVQSRTAGGASSLASAVIVQGQTTLLRVTSEAAGQMLSVEVEPPTAEVVLDGVAVGKARWQGTLPAGRHTMSAREEGYRQGHRTFELRGGAGKAQRIVLHLVVDPKHPRWPRTPMGHVWAQAWLGGAIGSSLRSGPELACGDDCSNATLATGYVAAVRVGYELPTPVSFELSAGFLSLVRSLDRTTSAGFPAGAPEYEATYELHDEVRLKGPLLGFGASLRTPVTTHWALRSRVTGGLVFAESTDPLTGTASTADGRASVGIEGANEAVSSRVPFVLPELGAEYATGPWRVTAALGGVFLLGTGPDYPRSSVTVDGACAAANPGAPACAPAYELVAGERAHGPTLLWVPQVQVAHVF